VLVYDWIHAAKRSIQRHAVVNTVKNFGVGNSITVTLRTAGFLDFAHRPEF
jgi:hypothetical protein